MTTVRVSAAPPARDVAPTMSLRHPPVDEVVHALGETELLRCFHDLEFCYHHGFASTYEHDLFVILAELADRGYDAEMLLPAAG